MSRAFDKNLVHSTPKATATEDELIDLSSEVYAHSFNVVYQLFECIWTGPRALSVTSVIEGQNPIIFLQW
jgi:hypothetical protein